MAQLLTVNDVKSLTDAELRQQLLNYGLDIGPIMVTTRKVYERKLERMLQNIGLEPVDVEDISDQDNDDAVASHMTPTRESPPVVYPQLNHSPIRQCFPTDTTEPTPRAPVVRDPNSRYVPRTRLVQPPSRQQVTKCNAAKCGMSLWIKLIIFTLTAGVFYLVYINMETAAKIPEALQSDIADL